MQIAQNPAWKLRACAAFRRAFIELYQDVPIGGITVSLLCAKAGYSRSTFYSYYNDIYDLLGALEKELLDDLGPIYVLPANVHRLAAVRDGGVLESCAAWLHKCYENRTFLKALLGEHGDAAFQFKLKDSLRGCLWAVAMFDGAPDDDRTRALTEYQISGIIGVLQYYFDHRDVFNVDEAAELINTIRKQWLRARRRSGAERPARPAR